MKHTRDPGAELRRICAIPIGIEPEVKDPIDSAGSQAKIFKVALPVSLEAVFQTSLGFVDQIIVGILGATGGSA